MVIKMKTKKYTSNSVQETIELAKDLAVNINEGCLILLNGDLGTGKTAFTKGIAQGLGIESTITSPTFTLLKEYKGRLDLKHIDAYRLEGLDSDSLGLYDLMDSDSVIVLEWGDFIKDQSLNPRYVINLEYVDETVRNIEINEVL